MQPARPQTREQLEAALVQAANRLGLQVNGGVASAAAVGDAFNVFQATFNLYQDIVKRIAEENESLKQENKTLRDEANALKGKTAHKA